MVCCEPHLTTSVACDTLVTYSAAGATNRPDALDAALRRAGRFDREIAVGIPSEAARASILRVLTRPLRLSGDFDFAAVAKRTPGFVGADLQVGHGPA